ncbi:MAG: class I SAM-dependent methyltransferase [candidate division KSB1 bacterium]|nr:class I SAM-dependent methyltransferase [candidate division KSB1 bacterium]MDZ7273580.1 class I SAM-dependent methyltransferase [candidate division KSB1 bacterium]MDZ7286829.1 class I SAM-dependent methyltransferase [candidate division KSB1 bacterium]MDZ7299814.1 class I SAM-dependent methyltransferase [candidate division KSB1 bacterium]MDZ7308461.1 class I SAM-dependent methyltransferase [candidate division KSB1 bacterium]
MAEGPCPCFCEALHFHEKPTLASRKLVADQAILAAVRHHQPRRVLDLGCGEGWLARCLAQPGRKVLGVDAIPALIAAARQRGRAAFAVCSDEEIAAGALAPHGRFDAVVCNFSLLGEKSVEKRLRAVPALRSHRGRLFVQTLPPRVACGREPDCDGWRPGSWQGCGPGFTRPAPWYFRTVRSWLNLFTRCGLRLVECREPLHPHTLAPAAILFICAAPKPAA